MKSLLLLFLAALPFAAFSADRPNILMIAVDDLRPQLGCYGQSQIHSPNLDRLASQGTLFQRAYCMVPTCGASRASLMTSIRPAPKRFVTHLAYAEKDAPGITTLNTHLKENGYHTVSNGKIFHHPEDSAIGWTEPAWRPSPGKPGATAPEDMPKKKAANGPEKSSGQNKGKGKGKGAAKKGKPERGVPYEISPLEDHQLSDGLVAEKTIKDLRRLKDQDQPFFIAAGFFKPHLPFIAPKKYWDLYPEDSIKLPSNYHAPKDAPAESIHNSGELRAYKGIPKTGPLPEDMALNMIRGYQACVSFTDAQIGKVLEELDRLGLTENTIVILWGDHGWNLGEHTLWCKHSCYETSMQVPLIIRAPGFKGGLKTAGLTELIDVYPTLCELAGVPTPAHVQGRSFVPLMKTPGMQWKEQAIGRFMAGDTLRTEEHRFTEYSNNQGQPTARMLYDHTRDPAENINLSEQPAQAETVEQLTARLRSAKGKDGDLPVKK
ncbi:sulfatase [Prosthecobacter sp. SYSU 5D2]|uniref:sulfatase n=1 Tax=Prosthecobacter sp. SYSU 5D2 TaxID=3134134 RepID=UPI0031FE6199